MKTLFLTSIAVLFLATGAAHADGVMLFLKPYKADGPTTTTILGIRERCPEDTQRMFDKATPDNPVWIKLEGKEYEILEVRCIGKEAAQVPLPRPRPKQTLPR